MTSTTLANYSSLYIFLQYASALKTAAEAFQEAETLFNDPEYDERIGWKADTENDEGIVVYSKHTPKGKMVTVSVGSLNLFLCKTPFKTELDLDFDSVMEETWTGVKGLAKWNPNINFAKTIASPTPHFDIITYGNNDILIVSGRDFVSARIYRKTPNGYIMASRSVDLADYPEKDGKVRYVMFSMMCLC
ncbi:unnamed protein product [Strongylus vulgaris]|uniref:START domain-containing protein n=1 Tax=Strongylus vulgaris TaxID=40348 RepID=A0A3P7JAJ2_STRVU|nr:unnamed protein product [Strongylus vulgaris]